VGALAHNLLAAADLGQLLQPRVWHCDHADVGLDRAEREVRGGGLAILHNRIEQRGLRAGRGGGGGQRGRAGGMGGAAGIGL
jgi:hypothetical protein